MNKRINELSIQCWYTDSDTGKEEFNRTKFAEMIIRECASLAYDGPGGILEHFGIEE